MRTILIADSGSTKTDWALVNGQWIMENGQLSEDDKQLSIVNYPLSIIKTQGIIPFQMDEDTIRRILNEELKLQLEQCYGKAATHQQLDICFYGSGVRPELEVKMELLLHEAFPEAQTVEAKSDLLGAARALCGHDEGIACILGTGANTCLFDGSHIVMNTPALGYVLGDEGSGANLGIRFLNALYKNRLPQQVREAFEQQTGLTMTDVIHRVYREPLANRFLASLSTFIHTQLAVGEVSRLVTDSFREFVQKNILPYGRRDLQVSAVGSIAFYYREQLRQALLAEGYRLGKVMRSPIEGLVQMEHLG